MSDAKLVRVGEVLGRSAPPIGSAEVIAAVAYGTSDEGTAHVGLLVDGKPDDPGEARAICLDFEAARALAKMIMRAADKAEILS